MNELIIKALLNQVDEDGPFSIEINVTMDLVITVDGTLYRQYQYDSLGDEPDYYTLIHREFLFTEICISTDESEKYYTCKEIIELQNELNF
jgi:hypothetical protein